MLSEAASGLVDKSIVALPKILLILVLAFVAFRILKFASGRLEKIIKDEETSSRKAQKMRMQTLSRVVDATGTFVIVMIGGMMIIQQMGINIGPIIAGAGIAGLAVGFGAQNLVRDFVSGFFILLENQFTVGDVVRIAGIGGLVEPMSLRVIKLRDIEGIALYS